MRKFWQRSRRQTTLPPAEGYRRWAPDYGLEPNAFQTLEAPALERLLPDVSGRRVLDVGCGKGRVSRLALARGAARAVACDLAPAMLFDRRALRSPKLARLAAGLPALPFRSQSFDVTVCALVLGHVKDLDAALAAIAATLRPGGWLVLSDFHPYATLRGWERTFEDPQTGETCAIAQHAHRFADYQRGCARLGLDWEALEEPEWQGFPVVFVLRARKRRDVGGSPAGARG